MTTASNPTAPAFNTPGIVREIARLRRVDHVTNLGYLAFEYACLAAVIGGTSLSGGVGTIAGAILGALIMQSLQSGMILLNISTPMQPVVIGLVLISAVWLDTVYQRRRR